MKLQQMPKLSELTVEVLIHCVKPLLQLLLSLGAYWVVGRVVVNVGKKNSLGKCRLDVLARASVAVATCTDLQNCQQATHATETS